MYEYRRYQIKTKAGKKVGHTVDVAHEGDVILVNDYHYLSKINQSFKGKKYPKGKACRSNLGVGRDDRFDAALDPLNSSPSTRGTCTLNLVSRKFWLVIKGR